MFPIPFVTQSSRGRTQPHCSECSRAFWHQLEPFCRRAGTVHFFLCAPLWMFQLAFEELARYLRTKWRWSWDRCVWVSCLRGWTAPTESDRKKTCRSRRECSCICPFSMLDLNVVSSAWRWSLHHSTLYFIIIIFFFLLFAYFYFMVMLLEQVYRLVSAGSIEEHKYFAAIRKTQLSDMVMSWGIPQSSPTCHWWLQKCHF